MKIFLIIGEDHFYHPSLVADFIKETKDEVVGAVLVAKAPKKADLQKYLIKHFYFLTPIELLKLIVFTTKAMFLDNIRFLFKNKTFYSVESVFKAYNIDYFKAKVNINKPGYLEKIRKTLPDVIISSNPCIFKEELLNLPRYCCINRHSSLLPSYGGLWPVFWAYTKGEKYTGVTIHTMVKEIDKGIILSQKKVEITPKDTISNLYKKTYQLSVSALLEALEKIRSGFLRTNEMSREDMDERASSLDQTIARDCEASSYYGFPHKKDWLEFRKHGGRFI